MAAPDPEAWPSWWGTGKGGNGAAATATATGPFPSRDPTPTGETYVGTVKSKTMKFGFVHSPNAMMKYHSDIFCLGNQLANVEIGEEVLVEVGLSMQGKPQAITVNGEKGDKNFSMNMMNSGGCGGFGMKGKGKGERGPTPTGETYTCTIKSKTFKFGFAHCEEVMRKYGKDVFCRGDQVLFHEIGEEVVVEVGLNLQNEPQAITVNGEKGNKEFVDMMFGKGKGWEQAAQGETQDVAFEPGALGFNYDGDSGRIASVNPGQAKDNGVEVGWVISLIDGMPFTKELMLSMRTVEMPYVVTFTKPGGGGGGGGKGFGGQDEMWAMMSQMSATMGKGKAMSMMGLPYKRKTPTSTGEVFIGWVKSNKAQFGFIECVETYAKYGKDVFCLAEQLAAFTVGDCVQFDIGLNDRGQPQAINVEASAGGAGAEAAAGGGCWAITMQGKGGHAALQDADWPAALQDAEWPETTDITFAPGTLGFNYDGDSGRVHQVGPGQAQDNGVEAGWVISFIDGVPFTKEAMVAMRASDAPYTISFARPAAGGASSYGGGAKGWSGSPGGAMMAMPPSKVARTTF